MAENASINCCHCVGIENLNSGNFFKAKRIVDQCTREDGKRYLKIQWEDSWAEEGEIQLCSDILQQFQKSGKTQMELLAHAENIDDNSQVFVIRTNNAFVNDGGSLSVSGLEGQHLIDKMAELSKSQKSSADGEMEDVKLVTYAQLQKAGFLVDEDEGPVAEQLDSASSSSTHQQQQQQQQQPQNLRVLHDEVLENARSQMYTQVASGNGGGNNKCTLNYVHNDIESSRLRRSYIPRRRQPFQLYKCNLCGAEFVHRTHLKIHQRTHTGEKPYKCQYCGRCFAQKGNLHVHMKIHTGEKDFICEYCQRAFITNAQLFVHMRTHTNPNRKRPYVTGRPPKVAASTDGKKNGDTDSSSTNQVVVQLIEQEQKELDGKRKKNENNEYQNNGGIPTLAVEEEELENLADENGAMNNLPSLHSTNSHETFMSSHSDPFSQGNTTGSSNAVSSSEFVRILRTQQQE